MNESFYKVSSELLSRVDITAFDKLLASVLYSRNNFFRDRGQLHYDKLSDLALMLGASRRTVERSLADLISKGIVIADKVSITDLADERTGRTAKEGAKKSVITKWVFYDVVVTKPKKVSKPPTPQTPKPPPKVYIPELDAEDPDDDCPF
jgi:hypothetical protein